MDKWNLIIDVGRCTNCSNCFLTVKDEHCGNEFPGYSLPQPNHGHRWLDIKKRERGSGSLMDVAYLPVTCNQCDEAPCLAAGGGAVRKRPDGIVLIDPEAAKGRRDIVKSCPYGHVWWNEELDVPQKWSWDAHLLDQGWKAPRPAGACGSQAFNAVKISDEEMRKRALDEGLEVLRPELDTKPRVWYKNLHRFQRDFIAGSAAIRLPDGREDCLEGAKVELWQEDKLLAETRTDWFGDFKFDNLPPDSGSYAVKIGFEGK
ncbi:MAG: oxidoreductase, partial [Deltaproteobacteria bacterium]|nr:oxidoreductase [Deltaproteobacteria bacterium]